MKELIMSTISSVPKELEIFLLTMLLPLASVIAIFLRRDFIKGKVKTVMFVVGFVLLSYVIFEEFSHHSDGVSIVQIFFAASAAIVTYVILSFAHKHNDQKTNVRGVAFAEFLHSLLDGVLIGSAYLVNPLLGYGAFLAVVSHETPKIIGTVLLIRSLSKNVWETIKYSAICQAGVPIAAIFVFTLGEKISGEWLHTVKLAAIATLFAILVRVAIHSFRHRGHGHE